MNVPFSETTLDLVIILSGFALTMALFFGIREKKHLRFSYVVWVANFALQCLIIILFHDGSKVRLFAILVLVSTVTVVVVRKRRLELS